MSNLSKDEFLKHEGSYIHVSNQVLDAYEKLSTEYENALYELEQKKGNHETALRALVKNQEIELMLENFDFTGGYNNEIFHKDAGEYIKNLGLSVTENGLEIHPNEQVTWLGISSNGLAAVNSLGGHEIGNDSLIEIVSVLEKTFASHSLDTRAIKIYHPRASDYALRIDHSKVSSELLEQLKLEIPELDLNTGNAVKDLYAGLGPRLAVCELNASEIVNMYNDMNRILVENGLEPVDIHQEREVSKFFTGLFNDTFDAYREHEFTHSLAVDFFKSLKETMQNPDADEKDITQIRQYYEMFIKRFYIGSELGDFETLISRASSAEDLTAFFASVEVSASQHAAQSAVERVFGLRMERSEVSEALTFLALKKFNVEVNEPHFVNNAGETFSDAEKMQPTDSKDILYKSTAESISMSEAQKFYVTKERTKFDTYEQAISDINLHEPFTDLTSEELIVLQNSFTNLNRLIELDAYINISSKVTLGGIEIDLVEIFSQPVSQWSSEKVQLASNFYQKLIETYSQKVDTLCGLAKQKTFYKEMDKRVYTAVIHGDKITESVVDVEGLRELNDTAKREAGNLGINIVAYSTEDAAETIKTAFSASGCNVAISRYGGDEFTMCAVVGSDVSIKDLERTYTDHFLTSTRRHKIPASKGADPYRYIPHEIGVNIGFCDIEWGIKGLEQMLNVEGAFRPEDKISLERTLGFYKEHGYVRPSVEGTPDNEAISEEDIRNFARVFGRTMLNIADKYMDIKKSQKRPLQLFDLYENLKEAENSNNPEHRSQLNRSWSIFRTKLAYSQKALGNIDESVFEELHSKLELKRQNGEEFDERSEVLQHFNVHNFDVPDLNMQDEVIRHLVQAKLNDISIKNR